MLTRRLGARGPEVSAIGLGTMGYGGRYRPDTRRDVEATRLLHLALDLGITFFDTAEVYGAGHSEELLGRAFADRRSRVVVATKFSANHSSASAVIAACDASLRRLRFDYIDLYQFHWPNGRIPAAETLEALAGLVRAGKVRAVGLGNATTVDIGSALACAPAGMPLVSVQEEYNLGERFVEDAVLPFCRGHELALIAYSPLGQGRLVAADSARPGILASIASDYGLTPAQVALQWVARQDGVIAIPMSSQEQNLRANAAALDTPLAPVDLERIGHAFRAEILRLPTDAIEVVGSHTGRMFRTLDEARANTLGLSPSPVELSLDLTRGEMLKPVKVRPKNDGSGRFELFEGQLRYWAWIIAHHGDRPIPAVVERSLTLLSS